MAAPPAKPSPSNKDVNEEKAAEGVPETAGPLKSKENCGITTPLDNAKKSEKPPVSYESSECSEHYCLAKQLLGKGEFEEALSTIELGIEYARSVLDALGVEHDLHESMAPYHYLYGTTLLYSIEESNDTQMTVEQNDGDSNPEVEPMDNSATGNSAPPNTAENVEDMEIAWENLETARNIIEAMLSKDITPDSRKNKLQIDLAQILLREGDLQRLNGRYMEAIRDYEACIQLRKQLLPTFDRKIADIQYNLGLSYLSNAIELQKHENMDVEKQKISQEQCKMGVQLYVECARTLCGLISLMTNVDIEVILHSINGDAAGFKTTGLENNDTFRQASRSLSIWRKNAALLKSKSSDVSGVKEIMQILDEIQETVDEAERSQEAVRQAAFLKTRAQNAVLYGETGSTTQIGFRQPAATCNGNVEQTSGNMLVVKKKKRQVPVNSDSLDNAKRPNIG